MLTEDLHPAELGEAPLFIETLMLRSGELVRTELHRERMRYTLETELERRGEGARSPLLSRLYASAPLAEVDRFLTQKCLDPKKTYRLTLGYGLSGIISLRLIPYERRVIRALRPTLLPPNFDYSLKWADRSFFDQVKASMPRDEEPLFLRPDGTITDTSYTNVVVELSEGLFTPARPLLRGTQRSYLLRLGQIREDDTLTLEKIQSARRLLLINALLPLDEAIELSPEALIPSDLQRG